MPDSSKSLQSWPQPVGSAAGPAEEGAHAGDAWCSNASARDEERLRESEERYRLLFEANPQPMWAFDADTFQFIEVNDAAVAHYGYTRDEFARMTIMDIRPPEDVPRMRAAIAAAGTRRVMHTDGFRHRKKDGTLIDVEVISHELVFAGRRARLAIILDVTERRRAEEKVREADRRKDEFLAMLSHELRNPLAPIRNAVHLLRLLGPPEPMLDATRDLIGRQVDHLIRLVDDLLDVSRISTGKINLRRDTVDLAAVVAQAVEMSRAQIEARRHELSLALPAGPIRVDGDFTRLAQVVSNLLNNAAKYTDPGGRIELSLARSTEGEAIIGVRDNGRGIDPAVLGNVFDLFFQADRNLDRSEGGLGIGLSLVKSLVAMHGGRVEARSAGKGRGSEFVIRLPGLAEVSPAAGPRAQPAQAGAGRPRRILVVDDNRDSADTLAMVLAIGGHTVQTAHDGRDAVEVALRERPELVILDIGLPQLDGYGACRAMRAGGLDATFVAMTGYGQEEDRRKARDAGFHYHLVKPVDPAVLQTLIAAAADPAAV